MQIVTANKGVSRVHTCWDTLQKSQGIEPVCLNAICCFEPIFPATWWISDTQCLHVEFFRKSSSPFASNKRLHYAEEASVLYAEQVWPGSTEVVSWLKGGPVTSLFLQDTETEGLWRYSVFLMCSAEELWPPICIILDLGWVQLLLGYVIWCAICST